MMFANVNKSVISLAVWRERATRVRENADSFGALQAPQVNSTVTKSSKSPRVEALEELIEKLPLASFHRAKRAESLLGTTFRSVDRMSVHLSKSHFLMFTREMRMRAGIDGTGLPIPSERSLTASHASLRCHNDYSVLTFSSADSAFLRRAVDARLEELKHEAEVKLRECMADLRLNPLQVKWKQTQGLGGRTYFEAEKDDTKFQIIEGPQLYLLKRTYAFSGEHKSNLLKDVSHTESGNKVAQMVAKIRGGA